MNGDLLTETRSQTRLSSAFEIGIKSSAFIGLIFNRDFQQLLWKTLWINPRKSGEKPSLMRL